MNAKEWANEIVNGRVKGDQFELLEIADAIDELRAERDAARAELATIKTAIKAARQLALDGLHEAEQERRLEREREAAVEKGAWEA